MRKGSAVSKQASKINVELAKSKDQLEGIKSGKITPTAKKGQKPPTKKEAIADAKNRIERFEADLKRVESTAIAALPHMDSIQAGEVYRGVELLVHEITKTTATVSDEDFIPAVVQSNGVKSEFKPASRILRGRYIIRGVNTEDLEEGKRTDAFQGELLYVSEKTKVSEDGKQVNGFILYLVKTPAE